MLFEEQKSEEVERNNEREIAIIDKSVNRVDIA